MSSCIPVGVGDWQILIRIYNQIELAYIAFKYISINNIDI